jgi:hypothetical protein
VNQHRGVEIAVREHADKMVEVSANLLNAGFIVGVGREDDYFAAVFEKAEMMRCGVVGKTHNVVAALVDAVLSSGWRGLRGLLCRGAGGQQEC